MNDLFLIYTLLTSIFLLSGVLVIVVQYLFNSLRKNNMYRKDINKIENDILKHNQEMMDHARQKAQEIINSANDKAKEIISATESLSQDVRTSTDEVIINMKESQKEELEKTREEVTRQYKELLEELYKNNVNLFRNISKDIEEKAISEIKDFRDILEKETLESQKIVGEKVESQYREAEQEIEEFKRRELLKLRDNIYRITQDAIELAIGKSFDQKLHEDMVLEALNEAIEKQNQARPASLGEAGEALAKDK